MRGFGVFGSGFFFGDALLNELFECDKVSGALALETGFLDMKVAEFFLVTFGNFQLDETLALIFRDFGETELEFNAAFGVEGGFEVEDAVETPGGIVNGLDEAALFEGDRFELLDVSVEALLVGIGIVGIEQDSVAGEAMF